QELLTPLIRDKIAFKDVLAKAQDWVLQVVSEPDSTKRHDIVSRLENRLVLMLEEQPPPTKPEPLSLSVVRDFFLKGTLPRGHSSEATFLTVFLEEVQQGSMLEPTITLLQTKSVREKLVAVMPVQNLQILTAALTPLPSGILATYQTVMLKADILKAPTLEAKQRVLNNFFLEAIGQVPTSTATQLIQHVLLAVSHYSQMPKQELFRRIQLVAKQHEQATVIMPLLEAIDPIVDLSTTSVTDALELILLPIYQALSELVPPSILPQYRDILLPAMKQAIQQGTSGAALDKQVSRMVETAFQALTPDKQAEVKSLIKSKLWQVATAHQEQLGEFWRHFLRTGEVVDEQYTRPHDFLEVFLAKPPIKGPQVIDDLIKEPQSIKRLVVHLKDPTLARLVMLVNEKAHEIVLKDIHSIYTLWASTSTDQVDQQDFRHAWWEAALTKLLTYTMETFQEKPWLAQSLPALAGAIGVERHALLDSLVAATKTELIVTKVEKHLGKQLQQIQQVWRREVRKKAKEAGLQHSALRELHKLLEFGLAAWGKHKDSALARLEQQLQQLFAEQGAAIKALLRTYPHQELVAQRLAHYFSDAVVQQFIALLAGQFYSFVQQYLAWANALKLDPRSGNLDAFTWRKYNEVAVLAYLLSNTSFDKGTLIAYHLEQLSKYTGISQSALRKAMLAQAFDSEVIRLLQALVIPDWLEHKESEETLLFQEEEETSSEVIKVYVQNGGLVFLWPFLAQLFEAQGLMNEDKFVDQIATGNAIHTLQYIATTQLHTAGWRLVLNKLLCGLAYDDVVASGYHPEQAEEPSEEEHAVTTDSVGEEGQGSDEETQQKVEQQPNELIPEIVHLQQTCEAVLKQVIEKWEGIKTLEEFEEYKEGFTLDDFRAYFLNRHSILRRIEGLEESYWHLTLPFSDYDSKDIYPPWKLEEIHLPWMPEKLVVFWTPE
ncbi:MAG: contractile injection system tape measure protein, partial [Bacteroidota bacterium]